MNYSNAQTVKELYLANLLTKEEARGLLAIKNGPPKSFTYPSGFTVTTNVTEWPPKPKPTRGEEIAAASVVLDEQLLRFKMPGHKSTYGIPVAVGEEGHYVRRCIADLIDKAIAEEREACAKVAERMSAMAYDKAAESMAGAIAERIRDGKVA